MTVEVCPICDIAGCHHIRERREAKMDENARLRAGKRYRDGNGEVKGPMHSIHWENGEEMLTDSFQVWHPDGTLAGGAREDKRSLVAEVGDSNA